MDKIIEAIKACSIIIQDNLSHSGINNLHGENETSNSSGDIQKKFPEVEKLTPYMFDNFRIENTSVDDVLDKILEKGINSIDNIDKIILGS